MGRTGGRILLLSWLKKSGASGVERRRSVRVLVVDDSRFSRGVLKGLFEKVSPGCSVVEAQDAPTAMSAVDAADGFDLITIDLHMPGKDGIALAADLREQKNEGRMALVTANHQEAIQKRASKLGMEFIAKPLSEAKIRALLSPVS